MSPVKILSRSGASVADVYDALGSNVGIDELDVGSLKGVHEMGGTVFAERVGGQIRRGTTGDIIASAGIVVEVGMPLFPTRLLGLTVITDDASRVNRCAVMPQGEMDGTTTATQEMPIWVWDETNSTPVRMVDNNGAAALFDVLHPIQPLTQVPSMMFGADSPAQTTATMAMRGDATAFGAGTVEIILLMYIAHAVAQSGLSSYGLPIPGW